MKTFLQELAEIVKKDYPDWENLTVVFPNQRAVLYFKRELAKNLTAAKWSPTLLTIEELIGRYSQLVEVDKLTAIIKLYKAFKNITNSSEGFDRFYYWGEMLLRDFDELDKYLINAELLFRDLTNLKEVDQLFNYLTEEQKNFLIEFWESVKFSTEDTKEQFLALWKSLYPVYLEFQSSLLKENSAYGGMVHRTVAENIQKLHTPSSTAAFIFAGFNALTTAEERIICWFVENQQAKLFWDEDEFYVTNEHQEAGTFFRLYRNHPVLGKTFPSKAAAHLDQEKIINVVGVSQKAGQPKLLAQQLTDFNILSDEESHVIVLPDESLLMPLLYSLPPSLSAINVTMGFPLIQTPYFSLIDFLFDLHLTKRKEEFYHRHVMDLLNHPYLKATGGAELVGIKKYIIDHNQIYISPDFFSSKPSFFSSIFKLVEEADFLTYVTDVIALFATSQANELLDKEFAFYFHRILSKLQTVSIHESLELSMLQKLFRQIVRSEKIPFSGEPLKGIQIMGVLETRNLDFDHVHILSLNEGLWPAPPKQGSYLPHSIRKAYGLPTYQHQDAMYAYLFYRLLQRSKQVDLYYNTETDVLGSGEMSRYLYQIIYEAKWPHTKKKTYNSVSLNQPKPIAIPKDRLVIDKLHQYASKEITPSALNVYLDCRLKFYFKNLIGLKEVEEVEEEADARIFGNIFHDVMQFFYSDLRSSAKDGVVREKHFENLTTKLDQLISKAYQKHFHLPSQRKMEYSGQQLVVNEMVKRMAEQVLLADKSYAPFSIEVLEENNFKAFVLVNKDLKVSIGGTIDRVDKKQGVVRIIDYKTGKDKNNFKTIESLFDQHDKTRNKGAFQAMLYAWVYSKNTELDSIRLQPGLMNRKEVFRKDFEYGLSINGVLIDNASPLLPEFQERLETLLTEIFITDQPFDQTNRIERCQYCPYKGICSR